MAHNNSKPIKHTAESARTWFCVLNNPRSLWGEEMTPEGMVEAALDRWMEGMPRRSCAANYEKGDSGTEHMHLVLCDPQKSRFSAVQKLFPTIHIEPMKGTKADAQDYILKEGRFAEKAHTVIVPAVFRGAISSNQGKRTDLERIEELLAEGLTPHEIMEKDIHFRKHEKIIRSAYFDIQRKKTAPLREITVYWHVGDSGTGKTYTYVKLCEERGEENVYLLSDYDNGGLDKYEAQPILFMDEFKGLISFTTLLGYLEGYKKQVHCRYSNVLALWTEVHITSIFPPETLYERMVPLDYRASDSYEQLSRRLTYIVYHYRENGDYKELSLPMSKYSGYPQLKQLAHPKPAEPKQMKMKLVPAPAGDMDEFMEVDENDVPFPMPD